MRRGRRSGSCAVRRAEHYSSSSVFRNESSPKQYPPTTSGALTRQTAFFPLLYVPLRHHAAARGAPTTDDMRIGGRVSQANCPQPRAAHTHHEQGKLPTHTMSKARTPHTSVQTLHARELNYLMLLDTLRQGLDQWHANTLQTRFCKHDPSCPT